MSNKNVPSIEEFTAIREKLELNQVEFAKLLGLSRVTISNMESGKSRLDLRTLYAARYLDIQAEVNAEEIEELDFLE